MKKFDPKTGDILAEGDLPDGILSLKIHKRPGEVGATLFVHVRDGRVLLLDPETLRQDQSKNSCKSLLVGTCSFFRMQTIEFNDNLLAILPGRADADSLDLWDLGRCEIIIPKIRIDSEKTGMHCTDQNPARLTWRRGCRVWDFPN